jgi:hypothetical protein
MTKPIRNDHKKPTRDMAAATTDTAERISPEATAVPEVSEEAAASAAAAASKQAE